MTILGLPAGAGFSLGTSSNIAAPVGGTNPMDMSLDDMIKKNRSKATRAASTADKQVAKGRAKRTATINARRGIVASSKPTAEAIDKEVYRQSRRATATTPKQTTQKGRKTRSEGEVKVKAKQQQKQKAAAKNQAKNTGTTELPPTWIGGTRRPPSKKAVSAAVEAMSASGFKVPKGMQMVISFAPAPNQPPPNAKLNDTPNNNNQGKKNKNSSGKGANNNANGGNKNGGRGGNNNGGRGGGGRGRRN